MLSGVPWGCSVIRSNSDNRKCRCSQSNNKMKYSCNKINNKHCIMSGLYAKLTTHL